MWSQGLMRGDAEAGEYVDNMVWKALCKALKDHHWGKQQTRPPMSGYCLGRHPGVSAGDLWLTPAWRLRMPVRHRLFKRETMKSKACSM